MRFSSKTGRLVFKKCCQKTELMNFFEDKLLITIFQLYQLLGTAEQHYVDIMTQSDCRGCSELFDKSAPLCQIGDNKALILSIRIL